MSPLASYCHCHFILIMMSRAHGGRSPPFSLWRHSHCDVIRYSAGTPTLTDVWTPYRV